MTVRLGHCEILVFEFDFQVYFSGLTRIKLKSQTVIRLRSYVNGQRDRGEIREQTPSGNSSPSQINRKLSTFCFASNESLEKVVTFIWAFAFYQKIYPLFESYCSTKGIYRFITLKQRRENLSIFLCALTKYKHSLTWLFQARAMRFLNTAGYRIYPR